MQFSTQKENADFIRQLILKREGRVMFRHKGAQLSKVRITVIVAIVLMALGSYYWKHIPVAHAQSTAMVTQYGAITGYMTGWNANVVMVQTSAPYVDNGCNGATNAQYATLDGAAGNSVHHAALLGAVLSGKKIALAVQGCAYGHPQIIGVFIQP
jgi:hypothetical protein